MLCLVEISQWILRDTDILYSSFRYHLPVEKGVGLYFKKLESPLLKDALCQVWLKFAH